MTTLYLIAVAIVAIFGFGGDIATDMNALMGTDMSGITMFILGLMLVAVLESMLQIAFYTLTGRMSK